MNDAIFVHDAATGEILDVNRKMCEMYGYSVEEARLLTVGKLSSGQKPYSEPDALQWITKASQEGPQPFEMVVQGQGRQIVLGRGQSETSHDWGARSFAGGGSGHHRSAGSHEKKRKP